MTCYLAFPLGSHFGWGICGRYCSLELARRTEALLVASPKLDEAFPDDPLTAFELSKLFCPHDRWQRFSKAGETIRADGPLLTAMTRDMGAFAKSIRGTKTVGYTFFEDNLLSPAQLAKARDNFDLVATGSSWCTETLQQYGLPHVTTVTQGVDPQLFFPRSSPKEYLRDYFVVFSGGKLELRKGQDVVIRAYRVLQDKYRDVLLVNSWFNGWKAHQNTMASSPLIRYRTSDEPHVPAINHLLAENGIDLRRVITLPPQANGLQAQIYHQTDVGLFPNRCEGGTNLVLMEYMACGKPIIATASTGHRDIVNSHNALVIPTPRITTIMNSRGERTAEWPEPSLDDTIAQLEWAYLNRDKLQPLAAQGAAEMASRPWSRTAHDFLRLLEEK